MQLPRPGRRCPARPRPSAIYEFDGLGRGARHRGHRRQHHRHERHRRHHHRRHHLRPDCVEPLPFVKISAPTMEMTFSVNDSPFAGREGKFVTSRQLRDRLFRETLKDVSLRVTEIGATRLPSTWRAAAR
ncbi:MAG: hypothetical protein ACLUS6_10565 [Dysosmobacter sp.]